MPNEFAETDANAIDPTPSGDTGLDASRSGDRRILSWSTNATQLSLQQAHNLIPPVTWMDLNHTPTVADSRLIVTIDAGSREYFRLTAR